VTLGLVIGYILILVCFFVGLSAYFYYGRKVQLTNKMKQMLMACGSMVTIVAAALAISFAFPLDMNEGDILK
jgi:hypothetical protein